MAVDLGWLSHLDVQTQAELLAGGAPAAAVQRFPDRFFKALWGGDGAKERDELEPVYAGELAARCARMDVWWGRVNAERRRGLIDHLGDDLLPGEYRDVVKDLMPGGVCVGDDLVGAFRWPWLVRAYVQMKAGLGTD
ncbi:hypothetical protein [Mycolicibacterium sp.]|uniref:hypothetical protein n=1 Tax=Mycolicibacterium sp. TaxID=2320850 RepID=UPI0037CC2853